MRRNRYLILSVVLILIVTLTPGDGKMLGNYLDKVGHFIVFFILAINLCLKYKSNEKLIEVLFWAILLGFLTEIIQQFIPGRNMEFYDALADTLGVIVGYFVYKVKGIKHFFFGHQ